MKNIKVLIPAAVIAVLAILFPLFSGAYPQSIARTVLTYMALAVSWDMLIRSGQLSFGIAGFFGIGSYFSVLLCLKLGFPPLVSIITGGLLVGLVAYGMGFVILRLRGMYFAITTLAAAEIFKIIIRNWSNFTGGPEGLVLPDVIFGGSSYGMYWLTLALAAGAIAASIYFEKSKFHLALTSIRNNEIVARTSGINIFMYLVVVFAITSAIQGMAGGVYAQMYGFVTPDSSFSSDYTLLPLAMSLLGGMYRTWGPVVGALLLGIISEYLKLYIPYGHLIVYGLIIVFVILVMPQGIIGLIKSRFSREADNG